MSALTGIFAPGGRDRFSTLARHTDPDHEAEFVLGRDRRESIAREAILAAARGTRVDEGDIRHILSQTVDQRGLSVTDIMVRSASMAEQYTGRQAFNWRSATPDQVRRFLASLGLEPGWRRAMRDAERLSGRTSARNADDGDDDVSGNPNYGVMNTHWNASNPGDLHERNWHDSPFHGIAGLDIPTARNLLAAGFTPHEIVAAGRDVERLAERFGRDLGRVHIATPENIARATRLNREAPGFMPQLHRYAEQLGGLREGAAGIARDEARLAEMEARGEGSSEGATALREGIARRKQEAEQRRREAEAEMNQAIEALPENRRPDATGLRESVQAANAAALNANTVTLEANAADTTLGARVATVAAVQQQTGAEVDDLNGPPRAQPTRHVAGPR